MSLARLSRPQQFDAVVGQSAVVQVLQNAIHAKRLPQAILLTGIRGVGKTSLARIVAQAFNCETGPTLRPCHTCPPCKDVLLQQGLDYIEIDAASHNGVDAVRALCQQTLYLPTQARAKFYIIDEAHMLSNAAFNALLKTLEEPLPHVYFILCTTEFHKLPHTVSSRCLMLRCARIPTESTTRALVYLAQKQNRTLTKEAARAIAHMSEGSMREAVSLLEQVLLYWETFPATELDYSAVAKACHLAPMDNMLDLSRYLIERKVEKVTALAQNALHLGIDCALLLMQMADFFVDLAICRVKNCTQGPCTRHQDQETCQNRVALAQHISSCDIQRFFRQLMQLHQAVLASPAPEQQFLMGLLRIAQQPAVADLEQTLQKLMNLSVHVPSSASLQTIHVEKEQSPAPSEKLEATQVEDKKKQAPVIPPIAKPTPKITHSPESPRSHVGFDGCLQTIRQSHPALASLLEHAHVLEQTEQQLRLAFTKGSFAAEAIVGSDKRVTLEKIVKAYFGNGCQLKIEYVNGQDALPPNLLQTQAVREKIRMNEVQIQAQEHILVREIKKALDAKIANVKPELE